MVLYPIILGISCPANKVYNPCISPFPKKTCDNRLTYASDIQDIYPYTCFEGCDYPPCPKGQIYDSLAEPVTCIPEPLCQSFCEINGRKFIEGVRIDDPSVCRQDCEIW